MIHQNVMGLPEYFLEHARHMVWLVALGSLFSYLVKAYFYPFFVIFLLGIPGLFSRMARDSRLLYLGLVSAAVLVFLYLNMLQTWIIHTRFLALFMIPAVIVLGFGLEKILRMMSGRFRMKPLHAMLLLGGLLAVLSSAKLLKPHERDKAVFRRIGEHLAAREGHHKVIRVACSSHTIRWVSFYANLAFQGAPCPNLDCALAEMAGDGYRTFVKRLKNRGVAYFLWEEKHWPDTAFDVKEKVRADHFLELGHWHHPDTGKMVLFKVL
jgi:hypothetical protein